MICTYCTRPHYLLCWLLAIAVGLTCPPPVGAAEPSCLYESGGNANLRSSAGANGYSQVVPATFQLLQIPSNIEAGIKYLGQLVRQLGREDYALAAYGGPARGAAKRPMPPVEKTGGRCHDAWRFQSHN